MTSKYIPLFSICATKIKEKRMGMTTESEAGGISPRKCRRRRERAESLLQTQLLIAFIDVGHAEMRRGKYSYVILASVLNQ